MTLAPLCELKSDARSTVGAMLWLAAASDTANGPMPK